MKRAFLQRFIVLFALCFLAAGVAHASELTFPFPTPGAFYFSATEGSGFATSFGPMPAMWTAGDFVTQTFFGGPEVADSASFDFYLKDYLGNGSTETVYIFLNGNAVAQFVVPDDNFQGQIFHLSGVVPFADITGGGTYNYSFVLQDTIPGGNGSIAFFATPEPGSIALFGSGLLGLAGVLRRKFRV